MEQEPDPPTYRDVSYGKAPITEAVIELRFSTPIGDGPYKKLCDGFRKKYPLAEDQKVVDIQVDIESGLVEAKNSRPSLRLASTDQTEFLIVQRERLSWSRLAPYGSWKQFIERVEPELRLMVKLAGERRPERIGVRFINRIDVPQAGDGNFRFEDYIAIHLELPDKLDPISFYQWRIDRVFPDRKAIAMMQSSTVKPEIPGTAAFLLDIDVFSSEDLPAKIDGILERLSTLRLLKNELFELAITSLARDTFG